MHKGARGFTLIELLVVIAIIGLLMTIIMVSLGSAKAKSRDARRQADIKNIQLALAVYYNENGMYPKNIYSTSGVAPPPPGGTPGRGVSETNAPPPPLSYHLGAAMEDTSGSWTTQDIDADTGGTYVYTGYAKCSLSVTGDIAFNGNATACSGSTAANPDACYDVAP